MKKFMLIALSLNILSNNYLPSVLAEEQYSEKENEEHEVMEFDFGGIKYVTESIENENVYVEYTEAGNSATYSVFDRESGLLTDTITIRYPENEVNFLNDVHVAFFTKDKYVYGTDSSVVTLRATLAADYYSSGSFRSFEGIHYLTVGIISSACSMTIANCEKDAWSDNGFPTTQINYAYTANVRTEGTIDLSIQTSLISAGFTQSTYFYRDVSDAGAFVLYH